MPRFFVRADQISDGHIRIVGSDAHHIARSLRMAVGDGVTVCDMQGNEYECNIEGFEDDREVLLACSTQRRSESEPPCRIRLFQALPKGDKLDSIIQKAVECGAGEIVPFESERCVVRIKAEAEERKTERRQRIADEAAKQCGRSILPTVRPSVGFSSMLSMLGESDVVLFCYEGDGTEPIGKVMGRISSRLANGGSVAIVIGSEGGFSIDEAKRITDAGAECVGLGKRILRTETASVFALSCLAYALELSDN